MSRPAIVVENLGKAYRIGHQGKKVASFREAAAGAASSLIQRLRRPAEADGQLVETFWALRNLKFEVQPGEVVGIIGRNGAGKSTLLKILSRITEPTEGLARVRGRLASLLEVGTGFHPELTGRENIFLNGSILGMRKAEIIRRFDEIVAFAEVERFLDTQVKHYSSGMVVRLAFSVAAHLETQIMVVDEVLAVGDIAFQSKCLGRLEEAMKQGRTVLFVSHNVPAVQNLCTRCILLERGRVRMDGEPNAVLDAYNRATAGLMTAEENLERHPGRSSESETCMRWVRVCGRSRDSHFIRMGDDIEIEIGFETPHPQSDVFCRASLKNNLYMPVFGCDSDVIPPDPVHSTFTKGCVTCRIDRIPLMPGTYSLDLHFGSRRMVIDTIHDACRFEVHPADVFGTGRIPQSSAGSIYWPFSWEVETDGNVGEREREPVKPRGELTGG
jgi:lipopolysaccharide transport system ATP-binding protein